MERFFSALNFHKENLNKLPPNIINLAEITPEQTQKLQSRVDSSNGLIRVFIHPFYEEYVKTKCYKDYVHDGTYPRIGAIKEGIGRILALSANKTPPVFIFEEQESLKRTVKTISHMNRRSENEAYFVPTQFNHPEPKFNDKKGKNWTRLNLIFKHLGVAKILIGGTRLSLTYVKDRRLLFSESAMFRHQLAKSGAKTTSISIDLCVGLAIDKLAKNFDIELSALTHPHSRVDLRKLTIEGRTDEYAASVWQIIKLLNFGIKDNKIDNETLRKSVVSLFDF